MTRMAGWVATALLCAGCVSTPAPEYFTLNMEPSGKVHLQKYNVDVDRLLPAEALERNQILIKTSPTQVEYYERAMWVERLDALVREKLQSEFGPDQDSRPTLRLSGDILAFEQVDTKAGADALLKFNLEFRKDSASPYDMPLFSKTYELRLAASAKSPGAVVQALSQGVEQLAARIATDTDSLTIRSR